MKTIYSTRVEVKGGRNGQIRSEDGNLNLEVRVPKEMQGPGGNYTNPEQLFAGGYAACFDSALNLIIQKKRIKVKETSVAAEVSLSPLNGGFGLSVVLDVHISGVEKELAEKLVQKAHEICPYSNAIRGNIPIELKVEV